MVKQSTCTNGVLVSYQKLYDQWKVDDRSFDDLFANNDQLAKDECVDISGEKGYQDCVEKAQNKYDNDLQQELFRVFNITLKSIGVHSEHVLAKPDPKATWITPAEWHVCLTPETPQTWKSLNKKYASFLNFHGQTSIQDVLAKKQDILLEFAPAPNPYFNWY